MDNHQKAKYAMGKKVQLFETENAAEFTGIVPMTDSKTELDDIMGDWDELIEAELEEIGGTVTDKDTKKESMAEYWAMMAASARSWALKNNKPEEAVDWDHSEAEINKLPDAEAGNLCEHLHDSINAHAASLTAYGITPLTLSAGMTKINDYRALVGKPHMERDEKSVIGIEIDQLIADRFEPELAIQDGLVNGIQFINKQTFVQGYKQMRVIDDLPTHHTTATFTFTDSVTNNPIKDVKVKEQKSGKEAVSDVTGVAQLKEFRGGKNLEFECSHPNYVTQTKVQTVKTGGTVEVAVAMVHV
jgi:hypothetical protein